MRSEYLKLYELTQDIKVVMMNSINDEGEIQSRPMTPLQLDRHGSIWFFASSNCQKTKQLERNTQINVVYASDEASTFVSISGEAGIVKDQKKIEELWKPTMKAWFNDGIKQEDLVLIEVKIHKAEYWDAPQGKMVQLIGIIKAAVTDKPYQASPGEHGVLHLNDAPPSSSDLHH